MSQLTIEQARSRMSEIKQQVHELNLEAEKILQEHQSDKPEGEGACTYNVCPCEKYVYDGAPGICNRSRCGHPASDHKF